MADSLGSLIDKLSIVNIKLYTIQDQVYDAAREKKDLATEAVIKLVELNRQRNNLIGELDEMFAKAVKEGKVEAEKRIKLD